MIFGSSWMGYGRLGCWIFPLAATTTPGDFQSVMMTIMGIEDALQSPSPAQLPEPEEWGITLDNTYFYTHVHNIHHTRQHERGFFSRASFTLAVLHFLYCLQPVFFNAICSCIRVFLLTYMHLGVSRLIFTYICFPSYTLYIDI